jgi:hypothetical protein
VFDLSDNHAMNPANQLWVQRTDTGDFAPEAMARHIDLQQAHLLGRWHSPASACSTALEWALWSMAQEPAQDGCFPWGAHQARQLGLTGEHWGQLHLCHWQVSNGQVSLMQPDWPAADALAQLWLELAEFVTDAGLQLMSPQGGQACVHGEILRDLPTAALDKVMGRPIGSYLPDSPALRRLQSEVQMWFYNHPLLQGGARPINSIWISGTGALTPALAGVLDRLRWHTADATPKSGDDWLCASDVQASAWRLGAAPWTQRLWRRFRPVALWEPHHELD